MTPAQEYRRGLRVMTEQLTELLKLASNDSGNTSDDKPPGVRIGDICSNGWASNRNPKKLFMYLGVSALCFRGVTIDGKDAGPMRRGNAVRIVIPRDTPDYWQTWEILTKQLPLVCLMMVCLSGCLTATKIHRWESALLGWAHKGKPECVDAAKIASKYLANANRTLQGATSALDLAADGEAKKLMQDAAVKCGEVVP
jgi:hypothetical protein